MNTISSNLKEEIKKSQDLKKKEKFKFLAALLITNVLVAILCLPSGEDKKEEKAPTLKNLHLQHQMMILPLNALIPESSKVALETPVSLISKNKVVIAKKAYLHEEVKSSSHEDTASHFRIEISDGDVVKVSEFAEEGMIAVPYVENKKTKTFNKGSKYEVSI